MPTIISRHASNWVDRYEPALPKLRSALAHFFERHDVPVNAPTPDSLSHWIASRLLTPDELARFEEDAE